jgi:hypothetical protein
MFERLISRSFELKFLSHSEAILSTNFPTAVNELEEALENFSIPIREIIGSGGGETAGTQRLRKTLYRLGWNKTKFEIKKTINDRESESITHEIDHVKAFKVNGQDCSIALEIEWNNKAPFFDRDLENFKRLHAEWAISVGLVITRGSLLQDNFPNIVRRFAIENNIKSFSDLSLFDVNPTPKQESRIEKMVSAGRTFQEAWIKQFVDDKFGTATTHWRKLMDRVSRGVGNPCPLMLIGLPVAVIVFD